MDWRSIQEWDLALAAQTEAALPTTGHRHDYTKPMLCWGHNTGFFATTTVRLRTLLRASCMIGAGVQRGDLVRLTTTAGDRDFRVEAIEYHADPRDMWNAFLDLVPEAPPAVTP